MSRRLRTAPTLSRLRSAVTNGSQVLAGCDHRSAEMRRLVDLVGLLCADRGGERNTSNAEMVLIRRAAMLTLQLEMMETKFALNHGEACQAQLETYQRVVSTTRRVLESIGLERRPRDATPDLQTYLRRKARGIDVIDAEVDAEA